MSCSTPVVFLIFRRPDLTARVFEVIRQAQPKKLFVVADGPRNESEYHLCQQARAVTEQVDWECQVYRNYSNINLGGPIRVPTGIDWTFEHTQDAIIIEDDCLPDLSFFHYCESLLDHYRDDERVMVISGNNFQGGRLRSQYSYYFSKYNHCWGWATWKRAWKYWLFSPEAWSQFKDNSYMRYVCDEEHEIKYWTEVFDRVFLKGDVHWDYIWKFNCWSQNGLSILPEVNLVSNLGFRNDASNTIGKNPYSNMPTYSLNSIAHPPFIIRNKDADSYTFDNVFGGKDLKNANRYAHLTKDSILKSFRKFLAILRANCRKLSS